MKETYGQRLKRIREAIGYSEIQFSRLAGIPVSLLGEIERGDIRVDPMLRERLIRLLGQDPKTFYEDLEITVRQTPEYHLHYTHKRKKSRTRRLVESIIIPLVALIAYLLIGFIGGIWHPTWIVLFISPIATSLWDAIDRKDYKRFGLPFLLVAIYLLLGFVGGIWHPTWLLFLALPLYYLPYRRWWVVWKQTKNPRTPLILGYTLLCLAVFFSVGFALGVWQVAWVAFLTIPIFVGILNLIKTKNWIHFPFPLVAIFAYLLLGFGGNLWHPGWVVFLSIPLYYSVIELIKGK